MKQKIIILIFLIVFVMGCNKQYTLSEENSPNISIEIPKNETIMENLPVKEPIKEEQALCNPPYFEFKKGECCLDVNSNKVCDNDELKQKDAEINKSQASKKQVEDNPPSEFDKVITSLINKGIDVQDLSPYFIPNSGNILRVYINAPSSDPDYGQARQGIIEMYNAFGKSYDEYCVSIDNAKNKNPYRPHEICFYCGNKLAVRDAVEVNNWDGVTGYCNKIN